MILSNILILLYDIGTYDVINATAYPNGNSICVECVFSPVPSAKSCYISAIGVTSMNKTYVKNSPSDVTVQGCIDNLPSGNYTVYVYDVENDNNIKRLYIIFLLSRKKKQLFIKNLRNFLKSDLKLHPHLLRE